MDLAMLITSRRVRCAPSTRLDQKMLTERLLPETDSATRGGCSLLALASPGWSLTRRGSENVAPPSLLIARYTSVTASFEAVQTTATVRPWAARDGVAFANPARPNVVCAVDSTLREDWPLLATAPRAAQSPKATSGRRLLFSILGRIRIELRFTPARAKIVRLAVVLALSRCFIGIDLHPANDVTFHMFLLSKYRFAAFLSRDALKRG